MSSPFLFILIFLAYIFNFLFLFNCLFFCCVFAISFSCQFVFFNFIFCLSISHFFILKFLFRFSIFFFRFFFFWPLSVWHLSDSPNRVSTTEKDSPKLLRYTHTSTPLDDSTRPLDNSTNSTLHNPQRAGALVTSIILDGGPHG